MQEISILRLEKSIRRSVSLLVFFSALVFASSFYGFLYGLFLFLIPLYWLFLEKKLSFFYGFIWGLTFFAFHSFDFFYVVFEQGYGYFRLLYPTLFVVYCALYPGFWFLILKELQKRHQNYQQFIWIAGTFLYFLWIDKGLLFPFGRIEGLPLCFLLLPLFYKPVLAQLIGMLGKWPVVLALIIISAVAIEGYSKKIWQLVGICLLLLFLFSLISNKSEQLPAWFDKVISVTFKATATMQERLNIMTQKLSQEQDKLLIFPESCVPFCNDTEHYGASLLQQHLLQGSLCIFGTHTKKAEKLYNSFIFCNPSRIIISYEKTHLIPFFEYNPFYFFQYGFYFDFFLHKKKPFTFSKTSPIPVKHNQIGPFLPVICSELFWDKQRRKYPRIPLICIANDSYFTGFGYLQFMLLAAQLVALSEQRPIIYCSWSGAYFINSQAYLKKI